MTSLIAWVAADDRGPASLNIATDSRISWDSGPLRSRTLWDQGQKVFASQREPILVGYVGDVLFPALALPHLLTRLDRGIRGGASLVDGLIAGVRRLAQEYPHRGSFTVYVAHREGELMESTFGLTRLTCTAGSAPSDSHWESHAIDVPSTSTVLAIDGSGSRSVKAALNDWRGDSESTSRMISSGFIDAVLEGKDWKSGGPPQWGALYRKGGGRLLGVVHKGKRYFAGGQLLGSEVLGDVEWRNELSERTDGTTKRRLPGAQPQPRPHHAGGQRDSH